MKIPSEVIKITLLVSALSIITGGMIRGHYIESQPQFKVGTKCTNGFGIEVIVLKSKAKSSLVMLRGGESRYVPNEILTCGE